MQQSLRESFIFASKQIEKQMRYKVFFSLVLGLALFTSCSKKPSNNTTSTTGGTTTTPTVLCDGKTGNTSYYPLASGDIWVYILTVGKETHTVKSKTAVFNSKTYFDISVLDSPNTPTDEFYRVDTAGNIYYFNLGTDSEYLFIPANPVVNQSWRYPVGYPLSNSFGTRKITALNYGLTNNYCTYSGLIQIEEFTQNAGFIESYYYKKGLGLVARRNNSTVNDNLSSVTLY
jgi:hypothetical protein